MQFWNCPECSRIALNLAAPRNVLPTTTCVAMSFEQLVYRYSPHANLLRNALINVVIIPSFSYPSGEPPTPTRTPTSPNFFLNSFQTPKQDSRSHGPFSPWTPDFPSATSPDFKTPTRLSFTTPTQTPTQSSRHSTGQDLEAEIASHVHHLSPNPNIPLPPIEPGRQLPSSPNPSLTTESKHSHIDPTQPLTTPQKPTLDTNVTTSMNSAGSMQTPPPTSTSASRRKAQQAQVARLVKESADKGKRMTFPRFAQPGHVEAPSSRVEESPQQFQALQFSPEGFGFPMSGPATAPIYPQHKLFWDPEQGSDTMNMDFSMDDTFTAFGMQKNLDPFSSAEDFGNATQFSTSPGFNLLGTSSDNMAAFTSTSTHADTPSRTATSVTMARIPSRGHAVNPSLLFSSPSRAAEASSMPPSSQTIQDDILKPYALQLRDAQIEMEMQNARRPKRKRGPESGDSPAVKAALQTLREDGIDGAKKGDIDELASRRARSRNSSRSKGNRGAGQLPLQKQRSRTNLHMSGDGSQAYKRTSVTLTIDASGRAKTKTRVMDESRPSSRMEVDSDDDSESSSSSSAGMAMSQPQSFAYPRPKQKLPPLGRFTTDPKSHSQRSSYASTKASSSSARTLSEATNQRRPSNLFMQSSSQHSQASYNGVAGEEDESEASTVIDSDDDKGDAQSELKKIIRSRSSQKKPSRQSILPGPTHVIPDQRRPYPSQGSSGGPYYMSESMTPGNRYNDPYSNISPTTITDPDLATPSTGRSNLSSDSVRCVYESCHDDGRLMIQW